MKTLPDNPNLDHLRRQAKDLLTGLRGIRPEASLADAQTSLAEQYGFRTWTDLKAEVDRTRGRFDVADPALAQQIADRFGLGTVAGAMRSLSRPDEVGRRWQLETDRGRWLARTVDDVFPPTDGAENARFQEAAAGAGVTLPMPVRSTADNVIEELGGHQWRLYASVKSGPPLVAPVSPAVTYAVGGILAALHRLRFPADRICPWSSMRLATRGWAELADLATAKEVPWAPALTDALPALTSLTEVGDGTPEQPVLCHNNLSPGNVRVGAGGRLVVTGWEHAAGLPPSWELAFALVNWSVHAGGEVHTEAARALVAGYGKAPELTLASFRGTAIGLENYVSGQIEVALHASEPEEVRFADRNVRHLLGHLTTRETFDRVLAAVRG
ncbi:phosphotransferase enzyme family protein [Paractinoplanes rishiriensis]|uniref:Aminoglycoside phosphotransferase domain-containing protein n=1 Tax=Paractinoplanes rishiriensis TaxID=1050105 RepID=A0A919JR79_9ACTN|nr:aminoglycoside phosphotransferase family protein [Actinoplanes rishiriensis]GIE93283.1 hypothetical protein Ari01nite_07480 [Actinoplanes rishiriensis]